MARLQASTNKIGARRQAPAAPESDGEAQQTVGLWRRQRDREVEETDRDRYLLPYPAGVSTAIRLWSLCRQHLEGGYVRSNLAEAVAVLDLWGIPRDLQIQAVEDVRALDAARNAGIAEERERWTD